MNDLLLPHFVVTLHHGGGLCQSPDVDSRLWTPGLAPLPASLRSTGTGLSFVV